MSYIIKRKINNTTYVYKVIGYRDESGKSRNKQKILGKLDADGNVIPSKNSASAEVISLESLKASLNSPDSLDSLDSLNSQNVNAANNVANDSNAATVLENNNDTIITASTNATTATHNNTNSMTAIPATATTISTATENNPIAAATVTVATATTASTTVADHSSDTTNSNTSDMMSDTNIATDNNTSYYDITEEPIDAVYYEPTEAQTSPVAFIANNVVLNDTSDILHKTEDIKDPEGTPVPEKPTIPTNYSGNQNAPVLPALSNAQDSVELVAVVDVVQESTGENPSQLPQVISQKAEQFKVNMSKLENIAFTPSKNVSVYEAADINTVKVNVSRGKSPKKRVETLLYIDFNDAKVNGLNISHEDRLTPYDREVHNAVATLVAAGNVCINPYMIFQVLSGNSSDKTKSGMSRETRENIVKSLNKMRFTNVKINASAEVKAGMILEGIIDSYLIPAKRTEAMLNGQIIKDCIHLYDVLPLFNYAGMKNQIASVDVKMLDTPLANTPENIVLKCYVLKRILSISNEKNNMHDAIRYSTVYEYLGIQAPTNNDKAGKDLINHKRKQIRDKIRKLLNYWKGEKLIKDYREEREGRTLAKVIIFVF